MVAVPVEAVGPLSHVVRAVLAVVILVLAVPASVLGDQVSARVVVVVAVVVTAEGVGICSAVGVVVVRHCVVVVAEPMS